jgi:hypothetical protein
MVTKKQSFLKFRIRSMVVTGVLLNAVIIYMAIDAYYTWSFVGIVALQCVNLLSIIRLNNRYEWIYKADV